MRRKLLLLTILLLPFLPVRIQAEETDRDDIHIRITEAGIQKTPADDIVLPQLLPGDAQTYTIQVENASGGDRRLYLKLSAGDGQLAGKLELRVSQDRRILYEGILQEAQSGVELGTYGPQEAAALQVTLRLPEAADNIYTMQEAAVDIELTAQTVQAGVDTGDRTQRELLIAGTLVSISSLIILMKRRRDRGHEEEE